ncbi:metallophosphoesterase [Clostridium perfringens]|uniref:metallophosphoesterase n=1 Tax=Clostridium perfringens TaxID=1502 RepID=UPI0018D6386D|nr:metallophosphoesterase [Clostridium perfringens]MCR1964548.1 metallophosphoesterase [Clostridium perfringens]MDU4604938.1 metallophosphoesterase [Clostridium perfringens]MDU4830559.1 metallophosphoesterase [Clostridium perfringens]QPR50210.1 metallophosphoesterase [Clostridium perfringens]
MKVAIVSDTHGVTHVIEYIKTLLNDSDVLIHLGDNINDVKLLSEGFKGKVYSVVGNCDYERNGQVEQVIEIEGKKFLITHGHKYTVKYGLDKIYYRGLELGVDGVIFGHTHRKVALKEGNMWIINPGSPSIPKDGEASIAFMNVDSENIEVRFFPI